MNSVLRIHAGTLTNGDSENSNPAILSIYLGQKPASRFVAYLASSSRWRKHPYGRKHTNTRTKHISMSISVEQEEKST